MFVITATISNSTDIFIMKVLLTSFGKVPYYVKKHVTQRKVANIKHELFVDLSNADDDDTSVRNIGDDETDGFVVEYYWEGAIRVEVLIEKAVLHSKKKTRRLGEEIAIDPIAF